MATVLEVGADDGEVAGDHAERVAGLARTGHRDRLPGGDGDGAVAGVAGGRGHLADVGVEGAAGLVHRDGGQALDLRLGRDHLDGDVVLGLGRAGGDLGGAHGVAVVGQHDDLGRAAAGDRLEELAGRGPLARPAGHDDGARRLEERGQPGPGGHGDDLATGAGGGPVPAACSATCSAKWVTRIAVGAAGGDAGLDRRADVVDVDVDVPQAVAADHHEAVAERGERRRRPGSRDVLVVAASRRYITS